MGSEWGFFHVKIATVLNVAQFYLLDQSKLLHSLSSQNQFSFRVDWESKDSYRPTSQLEKNSVLNSVKFFEYRALLYKVNQICTNKVIVQ